MFTLSSISLTYIHSLSPLLHKVRKSRTNVENRNPDNETTRSRACRPRIPSAESKPHPMLTHTHSSLINTIPCDNARILLPSSAVNVGTLEHAESPAKHASYVLPTVIFAMPEQASMINASVPAILPDSLSLKALSKVETFSTPERRGRAHGHRQMVALMESTDRLETPRTRTKSA